MLRLRCCLLTQLLWPPSSASPTSHLSRLISAAAPAVFPNPSFAVEEYLVATCGLTPVQAFKASAKLSHLKSPSKPDAVLAFLADLGLSGADVAALVAKDPQFLCAKVDKTLAPVVLGLTGLGLSRSQIARLVSLSRGHFRSRSIVSNLHYCLRLFGSSEDLFRVLKCGAGLLSADIERVVKPNATFLRECGLSDCDIVKLCILQPWLLHSSMERIRAMVAHAEGIGVPRGCKMFRHALHAVARFSKEKIATKVEHLKKTFMWSDAEVGVVVSKFPSVLMRSNQMLESKSEFLISEVGLEPTYIAHRPAMLSYSLEG
ncbi:transcription termination factor MTERF8, chloroplastic-like [Triticum dicoccoides]|nr:transcription termination factor MTERF8, chloroplastic-like [Triticum dicoccoides]